MNFKLKMRFVIFAHFSPSIPPRGVVAISPLFHFRRKGKYRLLEQRRKFSTSENRQKPDFLGTRRKSAFYISFSPLLSRVSKLLVGTVYM
jgi:hypothetical protein